MNKRYALLIIIGIVALYVFAYLVGQSHTTVIVKPIFTSSAYAPMGFYNYYCSVGEQSGNERAGICKGIYGAPCGKECLTVPLNETMTDQSSFIGYTILTGLGISANVVTDLDIERNPTILDQYDRVILLHNEYVTIEEYLAIITHKKVIYLYPNALYANVDYDNQTGLITLIEGHGYNGKANAFDWQHDNTDEERNIDCKDWKFYPISNGKMLNCYPEYTIATDPLMLIWIAFL